MIFFAIILATIALFASLPYTRAEDRATNNLVAVVYQHPGFAGEAQNIGDTSASDRSCLNIDQALDKQVTSYWVLDGGFCQFFGGQGCLHDEELWYADSRYDIQLFGEHDDKVRSVRCLVK